MEQINLTAQKRSATGKGAAGRLRTAGSVPGVIYGPGIEGAMPIAVAGKEMEKVLHTSAGGNVLVSLNLEGETKPRMAMFKAVRRHPLRGTLEHVDLLQIQMDHKIVVEVPIHVTGKAVGLAFGGIIQLESRTVRIECLPGQIPTGLDIDVTSLNVGHSLHIKDLTLPQGSRAVADPMATLVSVVSPTAEVAPKTAEEVQAELAKSFEEKEKEPKSKEE
ncbi:MAG: 50S ribosomal protein L25 [Deltaproteobacteria bacterium]|nr:50S ribosomal protein L25 [Deltaproteobacteria bacterium]